MALGPRLRELRLEQRLTVRQLAREVGVSAATISQVEREINDPSLSTLRRIARALDTPLFDLFTSPTSGTPQVIRSADRVPAAGHTGEVEYSRVSPIGAKVEVIEGVLAPGAASAESAWSHPAEECALVLEGTVTLEVGGDVFELAAADSAYFDSRVPHRYANNGDVAARFVLSITPPSY